MTDPRAAQMATARQALRKLSDYPDPAPKSIEEAIALQDAMVSAMNETTVGWKIGCTSEVAQKLLGACEPFFGALISNRLFSDGSFVETSDSAIRVVETEVALKLDRDIAPRNAKYTTEEVMACVGSVYPAIEVIDRRLPGGLADGLFWNVADCGVNDALVTGDPVSPDIVRDWAGVNAEVYVNETSAHVGRGANALGGADKVLTWFANHFSGLGRTLRAGDVISTGLITDVFTVEKGTHVRAKFDQLGTVSVRL